jgi:hypothetical protein
VNLKRNHLGNYWSITGFFNLDYAGPLGSAKIFLGSTKYFHSSLVMRLRMGTIIFQNYAVVKFETKKLL